MPRPFKHLNYEQRLYVKKLLDSNCSKVLIASKLGCHLSTIYREVDRGNINGIYDPDYAEQLGQKNTLKKGKSFVLETDVELAKDIAGLILNEHLSPERITEHLKSEYHGFTKHPVAAQTIYSAIDKGLLPGVTRESLSSDTTVMFNEVIRFPNWFRNKMGFMNGDMFHFEATEDGKVLLYKL